MNLIVWQAGWAFASKNIKFKVWGGVSMKRRVKPWMAGLGSFVIVTVAMFSLSRTVFGAELKVEDIKMGKMYQTGVDASGGYEARMFDKNGNDIYNKDGPRIVYIYDENGRQVSREEWTKEKRMYVRGSNGDMANIYCVQHGTYFGIGGERPAENINRIMDQSTIDKIAAATDYIRNTGASQQEEYFAVQAFIWSLQDGNESFGYSFGDAAAQKHPYEEINRHILNQQDEYYYGDYHGTGVLFAHAKDQDVGMFSFTKDTDDGAQMKTTARDDEDKNKVIKRGAVKLVDRVEYCGLLTTKEYTLKGSLIRRPAGTVLEIDGEAVTAEVKFRPTSRGCEVIELSFLFDASSLEDDEHLVVYEELWRSERKILEHKDLFNDSQTVRVGEEPTRTQKVTNIIENQIKNEEIVLETAVENVVPMVPRAGIARRKSNWKLDVLVDGGGDVA